MSIRHSLCTALLVLVAVAVAKDLDPAPPMGWMSWEIFRCDINCTANATDCINEYLYKTMADELVAGGYVDAGYKGVHLDDCWMQKTPPRTNGRLVPDPTRFPSGFKALGEYMHAQNVDFAIYTAESTTTCAGYPASKGYEQVDAETFAGWGVDYVKVDGCGDASYYATGYPAMGAALRKSGRDIVYSCSWPAYLGSNETTKPFNKMIAAGCNLWRNWHDIQCSWSSLSSIIDHWGEYSATLQHYAAPGHFNDPDMLLTRTQMAMWSIFAAPLIMGNDLRTVPPAHKAILLNKDAIAVDQDKLGKQGARISPQGAQEVWARNLTDGVAIGLYNKLGAAPPPSTCPLPSWNKTTGGYLEACGGTSGDLGSFSGLTVEQAQAKCCANNLCAGFSFNPSDGSGYYKANTQCGMVKNSAYDGYYKPHMGGGGTASVTVKFADVGLTGDVKLYDIWMGKDLGTFSGSYTADVPLHGTAFVKATKA